MNGETIQYIIISSLHHWLLILLYILPVRNEVGSSSIATNASQPAVIPSQDTLVGDLLSMDLNVPPTTYNSAPSPSVDFLVSGIDSLVRVVRPLSISTSIWCAVGYNVFYIFCYAIPAYNIMEYSHVSIFI